jgi:hypothetical protein
LVHFYSGMESSSSFMSSCSRPVVGFFAGSPSEKRVIARSLGCSQVRIGRCRARCEVRGARCEVRGAFSREGTCLGIYERSFDKIEDGSPSTRCNWAGRAGMHSRPPPFNKTRYKFVLNSNDINFGHIYRKSIEILKTMYYADIK